METKVSATADFVNRISIK